MTGNKPLLSWAFLLLLALIWGSSFILMKRGMFTHDGKELFSAVNVGALRMSIAALVLLPFGVKALFALKNKKDILYLSIVGLSGNFFPAFLFTYAETGIDSGFAGMLNSGTPIFALLIGAIIFRQRILPTQYVGVFIATIGLFLLLYFGSNFEAKGSLKHVLAVVLATFLYGISLNTIKHKLSAYSSLHIAAIAFTLIALPSILIALFSGSTKVMLEHPNAAEAMMYIGILSIVGTALALLLFNQLIANSSALFASSVTYFIPIVALIIGIWDGERIHPIQLLAMLVILMGVLVANYGHLLKKQR